MKVYNAVTARINSLCIERGLTMNGLANLCGLPTSTLKSIIYGASKNPGIATIKIICDGLEITLAEFFSSPEFDGLEPEIG